MVVSLTEIENELKILTNKPKTKEIITTIEKLKIQFETEINDRLRKNPDESAHAILTRLIGTMAIFETFSNVRMKKGDFKFVIFFDTVEIKNSIRDIDFDLQKVFGIINQWKTL